MSDLDSYSDASHGSPYLTTPPPAAREFHRARPRADPSSPGDDYHSARAANSVNESAASTVADDDAGVANEWARRVRSLFPTGELERGRKDDVALAENAIAAMRPDEPRARFAGVEGGGTTWVCAVAEGDPDAIVARAEFPTTTPSETLARVKKWLDARHEEAPFDGLGIATFGPLCLDVASSRYGTITHSPKPGWTRVDALKRLSSGARAASRSRRSLSTARFVSFRTSRPRVEDTTTHN
jgi:fructokinase